MDQKVCEIPGVGCKCVGVRTNGARGWKASLTALMLTDLVTFEAS